MTFHSEFGQDRWLAETVFPGKRDGVFVEFGALDGITDSNTLYFEREMGWSGLLLEPNHEMFLLLAASGRSARMLPFGVAERIDYLDFEISACAGWSGLASHIEPQHRARLGAGTKRMKVPTITLEALLVTEGFHHVDYMSIDVEGAEHAILSVFPFADFDVDVFGVENNWGNDAVERLMAQHAYTKIGRVGVDDFYRRV